MIYTFKGLYDQVLRTLGDQNDAGNVKDLAKDYLNQAQQLRLSEFPWPFMLWDSVETFSTSSTISSYALHSEFSRPLYFYNRTRKRFLEEVPFRNVEPAGDHSDNTSVIRFSLIGRTPVQAQPSSASTLSIVSSSSSDNTSAYNLVIKGISGGTVIAEIVTPNGTTPVATTNSFSKILGITKAGDWNGTLTISSNGGAVTNLTLGPTEMGRSFPLLQFHGTPQGSETIEYRFYRQPLVLVNDYDIPELPAPFSQILVWDALMMFAAYNDNITASPLWKEQQAKWEVSLQNAFAEVQSLGAEPRFVRNMHDPYDHPDFYL